MDPVSETPAAIDFRRFRVLPYRRELLAEGRRVEAAIYNGSPWQISRRARLIGEHDTEVFCDELELLAVSFPSWRKIVWI
jgi:hypothetical protein